MATYSTHRASQRIRENMAYSQGGALSPYGDGMTRKLAPPTPVPPRPTKKYDYNNGQLIPQKTRKGSSLVGYKPNRYEDIVRRINPERSDYGAYAKMAAKTAAKLGMMGARFSPYIRAAAFASDLYDMYNNDWGFQGTPIPGETIQDVLSLEGYSMCCSIDSNVDTFQWYQNPSACKVPGTQCSIAVSCGLILQVPTGNIGIDPMVQKTGSKCLPTANRRMHVMLLGQRTSTVPSRHTITEIWARQSPGATPDPTKTLPMPTPAYIPNVGPMPAPIPHPVQREESRGDPSPYRRVKPYQAPAVEVKVDPRPGPVPVREIPHNVLPPTEGVRERKRYSSAQLALKLLAKLYDATTEAQEIVDIFYENLGGYCKGAKSMSAKAACVWRHLDDLDVDQTILDLIYNEFEDRVYGKFYSYGKNTPFGGGGLNQGAWYDTRKGPKGIKPLDERQRPRRKKKQAYRD